MIATRDNRIVLIGNAGIGKSYMQLMILLWWARKELRPAGSEWDEFLDSIQVLARVEIDSKSDLFFKSDRLHYFVNHSSAPNLAILDSKSTLLLFEPSNSQREIQKCGIVIGHLWATVSPLEGTFSNNHLFMF